MTKTEKGETSNRLSDILKISWVKSSIILGTILVAIALIMILLLKFLNVGNTELFLDAKTFVANYGLIGIFLATILAGTIIPLGSPALLVAASAFGVPKIPLILMATTGFTIGIMINYSLAYRLGRPFVVKRVSAKKLEEVTGLWSRWGWIIYTIFGLIPVLPVELLSFACGLLKTRPDILLVLSFFPRLVIFAVLAFFGEQVGAWLGVV
jgi:membrane protein YqaA with SNARE-associated domain